MAQRRYQTGQLIDDGDRWLARWREDVILPPGTPVRKGDKVLPDSSIVRRPRTTQVLASKKECPTRRLAQRKLDDRLREINSEDYRPTTAETFGDFADRWLKAVLVQDKPSTQRSDKSVVNVHLIPYFGSYTFREMTAEVLQGWVSAHTASPKTIRNLVIVLRRMWATARAWGYTHSDPFAGLKLPSIVKGNAYHFSVEETLAIIGAAQGWKRVFFQILAETGVRPGELAGLRIEDVGERYIRVSQSVWQRQVQTPKTKNAVRTFAISAGLAAAIEEHLKAAKKNPFGLVFASETRRPLSMDNFRHRTLNPILNKLGVRKKVEAAGIRCGNYAFRHMNATLMDNLNTPLKTRQSRLGHADPNTTLANYTHAVDQDDMAAADQIGALLTPKKDGESVQ